MLRNANPNSEIRTKINKKVGSPLSRQIVRVYSDGVTRQVQTNINKLLKKGETNLKNFLGNLDTQSIEQKVKSEVDRWRITNNEAFADVGLYVYMRTDHWRTILRILNNQKISEETKKWKFVSAFFLFALYIGKSQKIKNLCETRKKNSLKKKE